MKLCLTELYKLKVGYQKLAHTFPTHSVIFNYPDIIVSLYSKNTANGILAVGLPLFSVLEQSEKFILLNCHLRLV